MKTFSISLAIIIISSSFISAQDGLKYYDLIKNYLPEQYSYNKLYQESFGENIKSFVNIHPDLIYYYLEHLNSLAMKVSNPDSNYSHLLNYHRKRLQGKKSNWALNQNKKISELADLRIMRNKMQSYLDDYIIYYETSDQINFVLQVDTNKIEFFNYIYFTENSNSEYNPETNYYNLSKNAAKNIITELNENYKDLSVLTKSERSEFIQKIADYWYLVDTTLNNYNLTADFDAYSVIYNSFYQEYYTHNSIILEAAFVKNIADQNFSNRVEYNADFYIIPGIGTLIFEPNYILKPKANIGFGFKLKLRDEKTFLSYLDIKIFYTVYDLEEDSTIQGQTFLEFSGIMPGEFVFTETYSLSDTYDLNSNAFTSSVVFPVFYISKVIFFEVGAQLNYYHLSYKFDITTSVEQRFFNGDEFEEFNTITESYDESTIKPNALIGINYQIWDNILMRLEFVSNISFNYALSYNFNL
jgi:hypothetical protein